MFDANMEGMPYGCEFFCSAWFCNKGSEFYSLGVRAGDIIRCKALTEDVTSPRVLMYLSSGPVKVEFDPEKEGMFFVFEGYLDGTGFICSDIRAKAMSLVDSRSVGKK